MSNEFCRVKVANSPLKKGGRGILSHQTARGNDEIPPAPFAKGGGLLLGFEDGTGQ